MVRTSTLHDQMQYMIARATIVIGTHLTRFN